MSNTPHRTPEPRRPPLACTRCSRPATVRVQDDRGLTVATCEEHIEWAFFTGIDSWTGRWRTA